MRNTKKISKHELEQRKSAEDTKALLKRIKETEDINEIIEITKHSDPHIRLKAAGQLCPCRVQYDHEEFWDRLFEMVDDEDADVRMQVFHNICDGSPPRLECRVKEALDKLVKDPDSKLRRKANQVMASVIRTGDWNIL